MSYQDMYQLVRVQHHGDFIVLTHWKINQPVILIHLIYFKGQPSGTRWLFYETFFKKPAAHGSGVHSISSHHCQQRARWWWKSPIHHYLQSFNHEDRQSTTGVVDFTTSVVLFSIDLCYLPNSRSVHSLKLSSHIFLWSQCFPPLPPLFLTRPDEWDSWPYHCSLHLFIIVSRSL